MVSIHKFNTIGLFEVLIRLPKNFLKNPNYVEHKIRENPLDLFIIDSLVSVIKRERENPRLKNKD